MAVSCHQQYCLDYVPEGILQETAIKTAKYTMQFWNALTAYIEDEYTLLLSFKLQALGTMDGEISSPPGHQQHFHQVFDSSHGRADVREPQGNCQ